MGTILVKKSDGTQVRMTMEEFKVYKANLKNNKQTVVGKVEDKVIENIIPQEKEEIVQPINQSVVESPEDDEEKLFAEADNVQVEIEKNETKVNHVLPVIITEQSLANTTPVKAIFVDEAIYQKTKNQENKKPRKQESNKTDVQENNKTINQQINEPLKPETEKVNIQQSQKPRKQNDETLSRWSSEDHKSLLEEDYEEVKKHQAYSSLPGSNNDLVNKILSQLNFSVESDLLGRLQSLVLSRIKDIRNDEQILDYALKSQESGGLGFSQSEAEELILVIKKNFNGKAIQSTSEKITNIIPEKKLDFTDKIKKTNFNNKNKTVFDGKPTLQDVTKPVVNQNLVFSSDNLSITKKSVGPLDELRTFDLKDWRRLSNNPAKAGEELLSKFMILKKESILSFLDGVEAWRQSPLFSMYKEIIATCISNKQKIKDYLFNQDKNNILSGEEFHELVKMNKNLV